MKLISRKHCTMTQFVRLLMMERNVKKEESILMNIIMLQSEISAMIVSIFNIIVVGYHENIM